MNTEENPQLTKLFLRLNEVQNEPLEYIEVCTAIGNEFMDNSLLFDAHKYYQQALQLLEHSSDTKYQESRLLNRLSTIASRQGNHQLGLELNLQSLALVEGNIQYAELQATILGNVGIQYQSLGEFAKAREFFMNAINYFEHTNDESAMTRQYQNLGLLYSDMGEVEPAFVSLKKALAFAETSGQPTYKASILSSIANVYYQIVDIDNALEFNRKALKYAQENDTPEFEASIIGNIGVIYMYQHEFQKALEYYKQSLTISNKLGRTHGIINAYTNIASVYIQLKKFDEALPSIFQAINLADALKLPELTALTHGGLGILYSEKEFVGRNIEAAIAELVIATEIMKEHGLTIQNGEYYKVLAELYAENNQGMKAYSCLQEFNTITELLYKESVTNAAKQFGFERKLAEEKAQTIERENILLKIFPTDITRRLIANETFIADSYESVSVFFSDIVDFTKLSMRISAEELVRLLNGIFTKFDHIANKHGLEKIKTIGDSYMAVAGAPIPQINHAERVALFALDITTMMEEYLTEFGEKISIRIGLHCGKAVAGVIGENKFAYDLWGDAVNTASRMESHGEAGKIHVSEDFVQMLESQKILSKHSINYRERGEISIKGKGTMKTYFLERL